MPNIIDWDAIITSYWSGQDNLSLKRKKQAEFLIQEDLNSKFIVGFGCYNDSAKNVLISMGVEGSKIKVIPNSYY